MGTAAGGVDVGLARSFNINIIKEHVWHNTLNPLDVTFDESIAPGDALDVINYINAFGSGLLPPERSGSGYLDVIGDDNVAPNDALAIINYINAQSRPAAATFLSADTVTQGSWQGVYGGDGYALALGAVSIPSYTSVTPYGNTIAWTDSTTDVRALQKPGTADRLAAAWRYNYNGFAVDVNLDDDKPRRVALYLLDWDGNNSRSERIDILDAQTGDVLNSQTVTSFSGGKYLVWLLSGRVQIRIRPLVADDVNTAVLSGLIFG